MIVVAILVAFATLVVLCWVLFLFALYALPFFVGMTACSVAFHNGSGWLGALLAGLFAAILTLALGYLLLAFMRPAWARLTIVAVFVGPAVIAGYHAAHGIVKHLMPSGTWQIAFSLLGGCIVGASAFMRLIASPASRTHDR